MSQTRPPARRAELIAGVVAAILVGVFVVLAMNQQWLSPATPDARASTSATPSASPPSAPAPAAPGSTPPVVTPPAWPIALTESDLFESLAVVWTVWMDIWPYVDSSDEPLPFEAELEGLGYVSTPLPVVCIAGSLEQLGLEQEDDPWGSPLYFRTAADAQTFVELWDRPVSGVTEGGISCDWN